MTCAEMVVDGRPRRIASMAFGRLERNPGAQPMSDINMTPLIDVMLVLPGLHDHRVLMTSSLSSTCRSRCGAAGDTPQFIPAAPQEGRTPNARDSSPNASPPPRAATQHRGSAATRRQVSRTGASPS
jgi:hypothetical protein